jgi:bile acid:Na+ symporter, BASS family
MALAQFIPLVIKVSLFAVVFALGLRASAQDVLYLLKRPGLLLRSIVAMNIVMLAFVAVASLIFSPPPAIKIAMGALALSPVPPILPSKQSKAGGTTSYAFGLVVAASVLSTVLIPTILEVLGLIYGTKYRMPESRLVPIILVSIIIPLAAGVAVHHFAPRLADGIGRPISMCGSVFLVLALLPIILAHWPPFWALVGNGAVLFLMSFTALGIAVGHGMGGPVPRERTVLALATGCRHPGIAMMLVSINFPNETAALAVVVWHVIAGLIVSIPYVRWRRRTHMALEAETSRNSPLPQ